MRDTKLASSALSDGAFFWLLAFVPICVFYTKIAKKQPAGLDSKAVTAYSKLVFMCMNNYSEENPS